MATLAQVISRDIYVNNPDVKWDDLIGLESAKKVMLEAVVYPIRCVCVQGDMLKGTFHSGNLQHGALSAQHSTHACPVSSVASALLLPKGCMQLYVSSSPHKGACVLYLPLKEYMQ